MGLEGVPYLPIEVHGGQEVCLGGDGGLFLQQLRLLDPAHSLVNGLQAYAQSKVT